MTRDELHRLYRAEPFEPFTLCISDGRQIRVRHPEALAFLGGTRAIFVAHPGGDWDFIDLLHVTGVHGGNGRKRGKANGRKHR